MIAARGFAVTLLIVVAGCGLRTTLYDDEQPDAAGSTSSSGGGPVACGATSCAADAYCFHGWDCIGGACSASCPCACGTLPDGCPMDMPCFCPGSGGYFGAPGEVFSGPDAGEPFPGHQVSCYGS